MTRTAGACTASRLSCGPGKEGDSVVVSVSATFPRSIRMLVPGVEPLIHITARGKISGAEVDLLFYAHFKLRDGRVVYIYDHEDRAAALEAAGLAE